MSARHVSASARRLIFPFQKAVAPSLPTAGWRQRTGHIALSALPIVLLAGACDPIWTAQVTVVVPSDVQEHVHEDLPLSLFFKPDFGLYRESGMALAVVCEPGEELQISVEHHDVGGVSPTKLIAWLGDPAGRLGPCGLISAEQRAFEPAGPVPVGAPQAEAMVFTDVEALSGRVERVELVLAVR